MKKTTIKKTLIFCALILSCFFIVCACQSSTDKSKKQNVIVILIDTLRADHLSINGYFRETSPNIDKFAKENLNFRYAFSAAPWTPVSVASLFTGFYPSTHGMMPPNDRGKAAKASSKLASQWKTLAELFKENGYFTAAFSPNPWIKELFGYTQGFDIFAYKERAIAEFVTKKGQDIIKEWRNNAKDKPLFMYLHYLDPHDPFTPPAPYNTMFQETITDRSYPEKQVNYINQYDGEIRYTDSEIGKLFDYLKAEGIYEDAIIVLVSDHGEQFMERGHQGHGFDLFNEEIRVPLILKANNAKGTSENAVSVVDIYPTLSSLLNLKNAPQNLQGLSLLDENQLNNRKGVLSEIKRHSNQKSFVNNSGHKALMIYDPEIDYRLTTPLAAKEDYLYNFKEDPFETTVLKNSNHLLSDLKSAFERAYQDILQIRPETGSAQIQMDEKTVNELKTLGYM